MWDENCQKWSKALNFRRSLCSFLPTLSLHGHENPGMIGKVRLQVSKWGFSKNQRSYTSLKRCTSLKNRKSLEPLFCQIKRSQLRWFGHVSWLHLEKLPNKLSLPKQMEKKIVGRPRTTVDKSILLWGSWVELFGTSPKWNDRGDGKPWSVIALSWAAAPATLPGIRREQIFLEVFNGFVCFSTVCSVEVAFVLIFHFIYQLLYFLN